MDSFKKKHISQVIKAEKAPEYTSYNFNSFNEKRDLEDRIMQLEIAYKREKKYREEDKEHFEKQLLQNDIQFQDTLNREKKLAYDKGFADGKTEGVKTGEQSVFAAAEYLKQCGVQLISSKTAFLKEAEASAIKLAVAIAGKIIEDEAIQNNEIILASIRKALAQINDKTAVVLRISESDFSTVKDKLSQLKNIFDDLSQVKIMIDERVNKGGVIVETNSGDIDARIEVQLDEILVQLLDNQV